MYHLFKLEIQTLTEKNETNFLTVFKDTNKMKKGKLIFSVTHFIQIIRSLRLWTCGDGQRFTLSLLRVWKKSLFFTLAGTYSLLLQNIHDLISQNPYEVVQGLFDGAITLYTKYPLMGPARS